MLVACLMLVTAAVPPWAVLTRDASALSRSAPAPCASSIQVASPASNRATSRVVQVFELDVPSTPRLAATAQELDRRYLYLELMTLLS